ncbi:substrate-binding domain-containing protein [Paraflavitalea speifideaquila]|uniref:substrate-binding domain-containing protein n=1 Tax=Paraflavitalea speifideaquila TaxID=3076558 RepID=UPI0028EEE056|nr:substrate-binding domain-containing protein [Paraflavitalea speifideiaquila]
MSSVLAGMENAANRHGYNLIIAQSLEDAEKEKINAATMFNKRVDGLLISLSYDTQNINHLEPFFKRNIPVVFFDRVHPHNASTSIVINNYTAAYNITKHLVDQGCRRIMHLGGNMFRNVYKDRFDGYRQALKDHDLPFHEKCITSVTCLKTPVQKRQNISLPLLRQNGPMPYFRPMIRPPFIA